MSDEEQRLLAAIAETPDDDGPRLVYADWLQSRGDPRGEFIQLQCQLAASPDDDRRRAIRIAENKLLAVHGAEWLAPVRAILPKVHEYAPPHKLVLHRGFIEEASVTIDCLGHLDALWEAAPMLRRLELGPQMFLTTPFPQPKLGAAVGSPQFAKLRSLSISLGGGGNGIAREIASSPALRDLRELELHVSVWGEGLGVFAPDATELVLDDAGAHSLATSPYLANLDTLLLDTNRITSAGVAAIAHGAWRLRRLELAHNVLDPTTLAAALAGPATAKLEYLGIAGTTFDPKSISALVSSPALANLRELDLERCHLGVAGVTALCNTIDLPALRRLRLERNTLGDAGSIAVAGCERLAHLTELEAGHNRIGHKGAAAIASSPHLARLERLTLNEGRWKPETAALFAASPTLAKTRIYLQGRLVARKKSKARGAASEVGAAVEAAPIAVAAEPVSKKSTKPRAPSRPAPAAKRSPAKPRKQPKKLPPKK